MATTVNYRTFLLAGIGIAVLVLVLLDRARISTIHQSALVEAKEDALRRQTAIVNHNRATLIAGFIDKMSEDANSLDVALFIESSSVLNTLWKQEKEIKQAHFERATVSAKRLLDALDCKDPDTFFDVARNKLKTVADQKGIEEGTTELMIGFLGLDSSEEIDQFRAFISRACADSVFYGDDVESRMKNAPDGEFRLF